MTLLKGLFAAIDRVCSIHQVEKIETIGDAYLAATGCTASPQNISTSRPQSRQAGVGVVVENKRSTDVAFPRVESTARCL